MGLDDDATAEALLVGDTKRIDKATAEESFDRNEKPDEADSSMRTVSKAIVPFAPMPPPMPPQSTAKPKIINLFPLYPSLGRFIVDEHRLTVLTIGNTFMNAPEPIASLLTSTPLIQDLLSSCASKPMTMTTQILGDIVGIPATTAQRLCSAVESTEPNEASSVPPTVSKDSDPATAASSTPLGGSLRSEDKLASASASENPEWSFLDLEKSIDHSLDSFINDLLNPDESDNDETEMTTEETALQKLLTSDCEDIIAITKKQKEMKESLQLDLDPSISSVEDESCTSSPSFGSGLGKLKAAAALLSDGESLPNDSSLDDQSEASKKKEDMLDGMTLGIAGLLGQEEISRLVDPHVDLPELFANEHFGSISEMVQEIHLMKAIQLEQKSLSRFDDDACTESSDSASADFSENERLQRLLVVKSVEIERQRHKIAALQQELEDEIVSIRSAIESAGSLVSAASDDSQAVDHVSTGMSIDDIQGWRKKFSPLRKGSDVVPAWTIAESTATCGNIDSTERFEEGIEIQLQEFDDGIKSGSQDESPTLSTTESGDDIDDGLDVEMQALSDFEIELRKEMVSAEETYSRSGSMSSNKSTFGEAESVDQSGDVGAEPGDLHAKSGGASVSDEAAETQQVGAVESWLSQKSDEIFQSCCRTKELESPSKRKVTFSVQTEEYYFMDNDADDNSREDRKISPTSKTTLFEFEEMPTGFTNVFVAMSSALGLRKTPHRKAGTAGHQSTSTHKSGL
eukprot:Sro58_g033890.3  (744) ;mRNA; r:114339-116570